MNRSTAILVLIGLSVIVFAAPSHAIDPPEFVLEWSVGEIPDDRPVGIGVDAAGNVYVADTINNRIRKYTGDGTFLLEWGTTGTGDGQFNYPRSPKPDANGNVFVSDTHNHRVQMFTSDGTYILQWGTLGTADGQFYYSNGVFVDPTGDVYVTCGFHSSAPGYTRIQKFTGDGTFLLKWGSFGGGNGQFYNPTGLAMDSDGNVYVSDFRNNRIQKFTHDGTFLAKWGSYGSGDGQFVRPIEIDIDACDNVYVADQQNNRIQVFNTGGTFLTKWGSFGSGQGQFYHPWDVAVDADGNIFVADHVNRRIQKFAFAPVSVTLKNEKDSFIRRNRPNLNEGANEMMLVRRFGPSRAVVGFSLSDISASGLVNATLVMSISETIPPANWGSGGRAIEVRRLMEDWAEGNGRKMNVPAPEKTRGDGAGVTWKCAWDADISNNMRDCPDNWKGGKLAVAPRTATTALINNSQTGEVTWDVTQDVHDALIGEPFYGWLVRKAPERRAGHVRFHTREGAWAAGEPSLAPRLVLEYKCQSLTSLTPESFVIDVPSQKNRTDNSPQGQRTPGFNLSSSYPNPTAGRAEMAYSLPGRGQVRLEVYNVLGHRVTTLVSGVQDAGTHSAIWNGKSDNGAEVGSGVYYVRLKHNGKVLTRRVVRVR